MDFLTTLSRVIEQQRSNPESMGEDGVTDSLLRDI